MESRIASLGSRISNPTPRTHEDEERQRVAGLLQRVIIFKDLDEPALTDLTRRMVARKVAMHGAIVAQDEVGEALFIMLSGRAKVTLVAESGREVFVLEAGEAAFVEGVEVLRVEFDRARRVRDRAIEVAEPGPGRRPHRVHHGDRWVGRDAAVERGQCVGELALLHQAVRSQGQGVCVVLRQQRPEQRRDEERSRSETLHAASVGAHMRPGK